MPNFRTPISLFLNLSQIQIRTEFTWIPILLPLLGPRSFSLHFLSLSSRCFWALSLSQTHGSSTRRAPIPNHLRSSERNNFNPKTISKDFLPHHPHPCLPSFLHYLSPLPLHTPTSEDVDAAMAEDSEVLNGGNCDARFVENVELDEVTVEWGFENRHGLHRRFSLHIKASVFLLHHVCHSQRFQALVRHLFVGFSHWVALLASCLLKNLRRPRGEEGEGGFVFISEEGKAEQLLCVISFFV